MATRAEHRASRAERRGAGSFYTARDVAEWLAQRAIVRRLLAAAGMQRASIDTSLSDGDDLVERLDTLLVDADVRSRVREELRAIRVLDPTCGAGAFLAAAWDVMARVERTLDTYERAPDAMRISASQLIGVDSHTDAILACHDRLEQVAGAGARLVHGDVLAGALDDVAGVTVLLGNPPYVTRPVARAPDGLASAPAGNLAAWITERALGCVTDDASAGVVLPISVASSPRWGSFRALWGHGARSVHAAHFDTIPSTLFPGVVQRLTLLELDRERASLRRQAQPRARWHTTRYHRWRAAERATLMEQVRHTPLARAPTSERDPIPKLGSTLERALLGRMSAHPPIGRWFTDDAASTRRMYYKRRWSYFLLFTDFIPPIWDADGEPRLPSELNSVAIDPSIEPAAIIAACSSSLFWWWYSVHTDNRNVNRGDLARFPMPHLSRDERASLAVLGHRLMDALHVCAEVRTCTYRSIGTIRNTYYRQGETRSVLDQIDAELARTFAMSDEELACILAYERRFRS